MGSLEGFLGLGRLFAMESVEVEKVIYKYPVTVVLWSDSTKTVVKCQPGDRYDHEKGLLLCIAKKLFGNSGRYNNVLKKFA